MKKVWLVSHYAMPPQLEERVKTIKYAHYLQEAGYEVLLVTASTIHNSDINLIEGKERYVERQYGDLRYVHVKCSQYKGSGLKRIKNMYEFQLGFNRVMKRYEKPDVIVCDCNCINYLGIMHFARKYGIKFISEIRDLWPLSIVEFKNFSDKNPAIRFLYRQEKRMYRLSDAIVFSMEGGKAYIKEKGWDKRISLDKVFSINNGVDLSEYATQKELYKYDEELFAEDKFYAAYVGSVREANSVGKLVDAAKQLQNGAPNFRLLIYGNGTEKAALEKRCLDDGIDNVLFRGRVDKKYVPYICAATDLNVLSVMQTGVWKYGCSSNKLFDYMAAGKPILSTIKVNYDYVEKYACGVSCDTQTPEAIAEGIRKIMSLSQEEYSAMCDNARKAAEDFDYRKLTEKLERAIEFTLSKE